LRLKRLALKIAQSPTQLHRLMMEACLLTNKRRHFVLLSVTLVFLAMALTGTKANPEEDEGTAAAGGHTAFATAERYARASPLRWGKRAPLRWGKRDSVTSDGDEVMDSRQLREAPLRWGKRASPLRWGKRGSGLSLQDPMVGDQSVELKRAPLRWGKRASPMRFGKRTTDDNLADYYEGDSY